MQQLFLRVAIPVAGVAAIALAWDRFGWQGVLVVVTALVMWLLLHFNRMMQVLKRAANRPVGYVDSAVMLNAKLRPGVTLLHVTAMTQSLGALQSGKDEQPEVYRWTDNSQSYVDGTFKDGRLVQWNMVRPDPVDDNTARVGDHAATPTRKIGRFGAAVSDEGAEQANSPSNPGPQGATDNKE